MNWLIAWFKSKNITTHAIAAFCISAAVFITSDPQAQQYLLELLKAHPALATDIVLMAGLIAKYSHSSSSAGTVANGKLTFNPVMPAMVQSNANLSYASFVDGNGNWVAHCDAGLAGAALADGSLPMWTWDAANYTPGVYIWPTSNYLGYPD